MEFVILNAASRYLTFHPLHFGEIFKKKGHSFTQKFEPILPVISTHIFQRYEFLMSIVKHFPLAYIILNNYLRS